MKEINEIELHLYIKNKALLIPEIREEIEKRIGTESKMNEELEEIKEFYNNYESLEKDNCQKTYLLTPLKLKTNKPEQISLAAQQFIDAKPKLTFVRTFISAEKYSMVRMFHNLQQKEYEFYVICEDNKKIKNAIIKIQSMDIEIRTDENGWAKISVEYIPDDIELTLIFQ